MREVHGVHVQVAFAKKKLLKKLPWEIVEGYKRGHWIFTFWPPRYRRKEGINRLYCRQFCTAQVQREDKGYKGFTSLPTFAEISLVCERGSGEYGYGRNSNPTKGVNNITNMLHNHFGVDDIFAEWRWRAILRQWSHVPSHYCHCSGSNLRHHHIPDVCQPFSLTV